MMSGFVSCALTGHRKLTPDFREDVLYDALEELVKGGCHTFYCGMAQGFDLKALECLVRLKQKYRFMIMACIPYAGQENFYSAAEKQQYRELLQWCDVIVELLPEYRDGCFLARNRYMVDRADCVLAWCKRKTGGTVYTVSYAAKKGKTVLHLGEFGVISD